AVLVDRRRRAVGVFHLAVGERFRNAGAAAGGRFVIVRAWRQREVLGRVGIAVEDGVDVVGAILLIIDEGVDDELREPPFVGARLGEHRHVGRQLAAERGACRLVVRERRREMVGKGAGPLEHLALVVGAVGHLILGRDRSGLSFGEAGATRIGEIAERQQFYAVAGGGNFLFIF